MKLLVTCDDYWHPGEVIERGLQFLTDHGYELDFVRDAKDILTPQMLSEYPLWINAKRNQIGGANRNAWMEPGISEVQVQDIENYIRAGNGFLALHSGNVYFWNEDEAYCRLLGCAFVTHPARCPVTVRPVKEHPVTAGVAEFVIRDEHYEVDHLADDAQVLLESTSETGGTQVAGFVRRLGEGRICALMPGHILSVFENAEYRKLLLNAVMWTGGEREI